MILYFTGTGNSRYVAKRIGRTINDEVVDMFPKIRSGEKEKLQSNRPWVFVCPTYSWRIPRIVENYIRNTEFCGNNKAYFVLDCGSDIGNAGAYTRKLCDEKAFEHMGCGEIVMPENYIAMFKAPKKDKAIEIIEKANPKIDALSELIAQNQKFPIRKISILNVISSGVVNNCFYPMFVKAKGFYAKDSCISCGLCERVCPLGNISIKDGKPFWGDNCTQCMACISNCPKEAIEYGNKTKGKERYICPM